MKIPTLLTLILVVICSGCNRITWVKIKNSKDTAVLFAFYSKTQDMEYRASAKSRLIAVFNEKYINEFTYEGTSGADEQVAQLFKSEISPLALNNFACKFPELEVSADLLNEALKQAEKQHWPIHGMGKSMVRFGHGPMGFQVLMCSVPPPTSGNATPESPPAYKRPTYAFRGEIVPRAIDSEELSDLIKYNIRERDKLFGRY